MGCQSLGSGDETTNIADRVEKSVVIEEDVEIADDWNQDSWFKVVNKALNSVDDVLNLANLVGSIDKAGATNTLIILSTECESSKEVKRQS